MGARKRLAAEARKEKRQNVSIARLVNNSTSPRKTRLMADLIRGKNVEHALNILIVVGHSQLASQKRNSSSRRL